jgi:CarboxypepD_reg-like domain
MIHKYYLLTILLLLQNSLLYSQKTLKGTIMDSQTKQGIPYASIGVLGRSIGTIADENGNFVLRLNKNSILENNRAIISSIGHESVSMQISKVKNSILLNPERKELKDTIAKPSDFEQKSIGRIAEKGIGSLSFHNKHDKNIDDKLGREIGAILNLKGRGYLNRINFFINNNEFEKVKFRLNIYNVKNNYPNDLIISDEIFIELTQNQKGWITVDVSKYNLRFENKVAVALQWIESIEIDRDSKRITIPTAFPTFTRNSFIRANSQDIWTLMNVTPSVYADVDKVIK